MKDPQLNTTLEVEGQKFPAVFKIRLHPVENTRANLTGSGSDLVHEIINPYRFIPCSLLRRCVGNFILY